MSQEEQKLLEGIPQDIPTYISELNQDIKKAESYITSLNGKIDYAQNIADEKLPEAKKPARSGTLRAFVWVVTSQFVSALRLLYLHLKVV